MTNLSGYFCEMFFHSSSRPLNCGVKPHFEAVLTARMILPLCCERGYSCARLSLGLKSKKEVAEAIVGEEALETGDENDRLCWLYVSVVLVDLRW